LHARLAGAPRFTTLGIGVHAITARGADARDDALAPAPTAMYR
jgi:hypothetical protein